MTRHITIIMMKMKIWSVYPEIWAKLLENVIPRNVEESVEKFPDLDPDAGDCQNLGPTLVLRSFNGT